MKYENPETYIFGRMPIEEALKSGKQLDRILLNFNAKGQGLQRIQALARNSSIPIKKISAQKFNQILKGNQNHQGIIGVLNAFKYTDLDQFLLDTEIKKSKIIILDQIEDPHNLGAIIRTAEGAGFDCVIIPERKSAQINNTAVKTSAGAVFHIPVIRVNRLEMAVDQLKEAGIFIFGTHLKGDKFHSQANLTLPFALVIGNEGRGIHKALLKKCDELIKIPMLGKVNSLNASVSAAILIYEAVRQNSLPK